MAKEHEMLSLGGQAAAAAHSLGTPLSTIKIITQELSKQLKDQKDVIQDIHESYLAAGADIVETNTFGGTNFVLGEYNLQDKVYEINTKAVELAKAACKNYSTKDKPRFVAGAIGPTTKALSVTGGISFDDLAFSFYEQAKGLEKDMRVALGTELDLTGLKLSYAYRTTDYKEASASHLASFSFQI